MKIIPAFCTSSEEPSIEFSFHNGIFCCMLLNSMKIVTLSYTFLCTTIATIALYPLPPTPLFVTTVEEITNSIEPFKLSQLLHARVYCIHPPVLVVWKTVCTK